MLAYLAERTMDVARAGASQEARVQRARSALAAATCARDARPLDPRFGVALGRFETDAGLLAREQGAAQHFARADVAFEAALALGPRIPASWTAWGGALVRRQDPERAVEKLERAVSLNADYRFPYRPLGEAYGQLGRWEEARQAFGRATELAPRVWQNWRGLGIASSQVGDNFGAADAYLEVVRLGEADHIVLGNLALSLARTGRVAEALPYAEQALAAAPEAARAQLTDLVARLQAQIDTPDPGPTR